MKREMVAPGAGQVGHQVNLNITDTKPIKCDECGNDTFTQSFIMRLISAVYSPEGEESIMPIPVFECSSCGHVNDIFLPEGLKSTDKIITDADDEE